MNIFVGCSSRDVGNSMYNHAADEIGDFINRRGHTLVFGGCEEGLMGRVYARVSPKKVICTLTKVYEEEVRNIDATEINISDTINRRVDAFLNISDVLVFLPGGIGTLHELFACLETRRSEHDKPIIIVNVDGFFDSVLVMLEKIYSEGLANPKTRQLYHVSDCISDAIMALKTFEE